MQGPSLNSEDLNALFISILDKYCVSAKKLGTQMHVSELVEAFFSASEEVKAKIVLSLVSIANGATNMIDLSMIGGAKCAGCMQLTFSNVLSKGKPILTFIDQSVTGMFERRQRLEL